MTDPRARLEAIEAQQASRRGMRTLFSTPAERLGRAEADVTELLSIARQLLESEAKAWDEVASLRDLSYKWQEAGQRAEAAEARVKQYEQDALAVGAEIYAQRLREMTRRAETAEKERDEALWFRAEERWRGDKAREVMGIEPRSPLEQARQDYITMTKALVNLAALLEGDEDAD